MPSGYPEILYLPIIECGISRESHDSYNRFLFFDLSRCKLPAQSRSCRPCQGEQGQVYSLQKEHREIVISYIFEKWSLAKICGVPDGATAFQRSPAQSTVASVVYQIDTPGGQREVDALTGIVSRYVGGKNVGYANYNSDASSKIDLNGDSELSVA
ncbi:hypothetical protein BV25DRAFT_1916505 [Artomyces pyxidatus]|uniref:Uncharacterized protein n=1 Tax=Artomyces pyxidatus TaxID=48021 RepID=A0ACB8T130_9AGAM|nr:hypothetical protein BV25DRAFT_1916505 [Artomyces pyxidatus]